MKSIFRPTSIHDSQELRGFLARAFGSSLNAPFILPATMEWKYWHHREDWQEPRGYVLERDGKIVAHAGILPLTFDQGRIRGIQMIDWASDPHSPGSGLSLVQKLAKEFDFIYSIGGSEMTCQALPGFGFIEQTRQWQAARPLRPLHQMITHQSRNWKLIPRLFRNWAWSMKLANNSRTKGWRATAISAAEISPLISQASEASPCCSPRSPEFYRYLLQCPAAKVRIYEIRNSKDCHGYFVLSLLRHQARIAGIWLADMNPEQWEIAFNLAQQAAWREGSVEVVAGGTAGKTEEAAVRSGLRVRRYNTVYLLNRKGNLNLRSDFQFQLSDNDEFFWDSGSSSYWT